MQTRGRNASRGVCFERMTIEAGLPGRDPFRASARILIVVVGGRGDKLLPWSNTTVVGRFLGSLNLMTLNRLEMATKELKH